METVTIHSPYIQCGEAVWLRGNVHTHTTRSDGALAPQQIVDAYSAAGYDFLALSDHDIAPELDELAPRRLVLLPAREVSGNVGHMLVLGPPAWDRLPSDISQQETISHVAAGGGISVLCHPNWGRSYDHYPMEQLQNLTGYTGIEIFNGSIVEEPGSPFAVDKWDRLLAEDRVPWAFASDDCHFAPGLGRGWCMVRAADRSREAILNALRSGSFYASTGVTIERIEVDGPRLHFSAPDAELIAVIGESGMQLASTPGTRIVYDAARCPFPLFRIECHGRANRKAWTQPFRVRGGTSEQYRTLLQERPVLHVPVLRRAPRLTGDLSDPAWNSAVSTDAFMRGRDGSPPEVRTELKCLVAERFLFLGMLCEEPMLDRLKTDVRQHGCSNTWTDDSVEIFLDIEGTARSYLQIMVNALGFAWVHEHGRAAARPGIPALKTAAGRSTHAYTLEIAIPLQDLGASHSTGRWGFNVVRNRHPSPDRFTWSLVGLSNHAPDRFGWLVLQP